MRATTGLTRPRGQGAPAVPDAAVRWGHWVLVVLILCAVASSMLIRKELASRPVPASAAAPAHVTVAGPVLTPAGRGPDALRAQPGTISLIFDGGPDARVTPRIVAALLRLAVPATFFVQGDRAGAARDIIRQELSAGDEVGMAGFTGTDMAGMPDWRLNAELAEAQYALQRAGNPATTLVRPPGATTMRALSAGTWATARRLGGHGYAVVLANREAQTSASPPAILRTLDPPGLSAGNGAAASGPVPAAGNGPGLVYALSDSGRPGRAALAALPRLVQGLRSRGYQFTTIAQAFNVTVRPVPVTWLNIAGEEALLLAEQVSAAVAVAVQWGFAATALIIGIRLVLMIVVGALHKLRYRRPSQPWRGPVSVVIPAYNEREGIERAVRSMVESDYPDLEVIVVDDGSTDGTSDLVASLGLPVTIVRQPNSGKATALNAGARRARHDILVFADGDTIFEPSTISRLVAQFRDPRVGGIAGKVSVANRRGILGMLQHVEYVASSLDRRMSDVLHCMLTIPGAIGAFRRSALDQVGGIPDNTLAEDTDLTVALGCAGWRVKFESEARAWTEAPSNLRQLWSQRHRWAYGTLQTLWKYRGVMVSPRGRRSVAWFGLPYLAAVSGLLPLISPTADLYVLYYLWTSPWNALRWWAIFLILQGTLTLSSFIIEREPLRHLWTVPAQVLLYRQLMYLVVIHALADAVTGARLRWHKMARTGIELPAGDLRPPAVVRDEHAAPAVAGDLRPPAVVAGDLGPPAVVAGDLGPPAVVAGDLGPPAVVAGDPPPLAVVRDEHAAPAAV